MFPGSEPAGAKVRGRKGKITRDVECEVCNGSGSADGKTEKYSVCGGSGQERKVRNTILGQIAVMSTCSKCHGSGREIKNPCKSCKGSGVKSCISYPLSV